MPWEIIFFLAISAHVCSGLRIVSEGERGVIFRLGRFQRVLEPGLRWILPGVDRFHRVSLNQVLPEWRSLTPEMVAARLRELSLAGHLNPR